jgi:hypothetical protein
MSSDFDDLHEVLDEPDRRKRGWPKLPGHDASLSVIRDYLTQAANLPAGWIVDLAERHGRYGSDPLTITVRTPGEGDNINVRFDAQRECSKPSALRGAFFEATNGMSRMKYPKPAEASDFYGMVCALARVASTSTIADETEQWLHEYLGLAWVLDGRSLYPPDRYDTLIDIQRRGEFDRRQAGRYLRGDLDDRERWVAVVDSKTEELWIRVGEFAAYLRHVFGVAGIAQHTLDARVLEFGGEREQLEENRRHRGGKHMTLTFYRFPSVQAFPTVLREHTSPSRACARVTP